MVPNRLRNAAGMTLMEILIVLGIVSALFAVLIPNVMNRYNNSKVKTTKLAMTDVMNALNLYYTDCGSYPQGLDNLVSADSACSNWGPEPYMKKLPKDAWNGDFVYSVEGGNFVLKSLGSDKREGGDGFAKDITSEE